MRIKTQQYLSESSLAQLDLPEGWKVHWTTNLALERLDGEPGARIDAFSTMTGTIKLGRCVHIGCNCTLIGGAGITIGDEVSLSPGVKIFSTTEDVDSGLLSNPQVDPRSMIAAPVLIGDRCVIGAGTVILPGSVIEDDVVVGALSLVRGRLESGRIFAGIPTRFLRSRPPLK
jgi:galactoside O-acetyltransferase